jgi:hypothetical protein
MSLPKDHPSACPRCADARREERARIVAWLRKKAVFLREAPAGLGTTVSASILSFTASALEAGSMDIEEGE